MTPNKKREPSPLPAPALEFARWANLDDEALDARLARAKRLERRLWVDEIWWALLFMISFPFSLLVAFHPKSGALLTLAALATEALLVVGAPYALGQARKRQERRSLLLLPLGALSPDGAADDPMERARELTRSCPEAKAWAQRAADLGREPRRFDLAIMERMGGAALRQLESLKTQRRLGVAPRSKTSETNPSSAR